MSSRKKNDNLQTPEWVHKPLGPFELDPCAGEHTSIASINLWDGRGKDGLINYWGDRFVWCNPPFSQKQVWIDKMTDHGNGILILPERASAPWFGPLAKHVGRYFILGKKINFIGGPSSNNLGSCLFPFGELAVQRIKDSGLPGMMVKVESFLSREEAKRQSSGKE